MKRPEKFLLAGVAALVAALASGCGEKPSAPAAPPAASAPKAQAASAPAATPSAPEIMSVLSVEHEVDILAERAGVVTDVVDDSVTHVPKGALLGRLDEREIAAQLDRARADLTVSQNNVKFNEAELRAREAAYRRAQEMHKLGLNSAAELEESEFRAEGARYDLDSWRAVVERTRAEIRVHELELEKTRLRAPFDGVVARRYIRVGQNVLKDEKCFRLSQLAPLLVRFLVPETSAQTPRANDEVRVALVSEPQRAYTARIQKVSPTVDAASGSYEVTAQLTGGGLGELRPGMAVRVVWPPGGVAHKR
jgi:membrane fusion protein (multidrug efflux system)